MSTDNFESGDFLIQPASGLKNRSLPPYPTEDRLAAADPSQGSHALPVIAPSEPAAVCVSPAVGVSARREGQTAILTREIRELAKERNAIILAHNYQWGDVQDVADTTGDSLGLALEAQKTNAEVIVFCGVHFMAESAKILNPEKKVLLPNLAAGCSLADSISPESLGEWKQRYPGYTVVTYVNSTAEVKAMSDICC
ncbi:MAG: quinolinate synthase NadA, partial [Blastocatellia bacterium]